MYAMLGGFRDTVELLIEKGARIDIRDNNGDTADKWTENQTLVDVMMAAYEKRQAATASRRQSELKAKAPRFRPS